MTNCSGIKFHPTDPCCSAAVICRAFPAIDWGQFAWRVTMPAALHVDNIRVAQHGWPGSPLVTVDNDPAPDDFYSYVGAVCQNEADQEYPLYEPSDASEQVIVPDTLEGGGFNYHIFGGQFVGRYASACTWNVWCRERLCPPLFALVLVDKGGFFWFVNKDHMVIGADPYPVEWTARRVIHSDFLTEEYDERFPPPEAVYGTAGLTSWTNWRHILKRAECVFLPAQAARGFGVLPVTSIEGGPMARLELAESAIRQGLPENHPARWFYAPKALDVAVAWTLSGGFDFGVISDTRSPLYGQFVIHAGGRYLLEPSPIDGEPDSYSLQSSPWELVNRPAVVAELGEVNRFERTDDNDTLPAWIEIDLIRI